MLTKFARLTLLCGVIVAGLILLSLPNSALAAPATFTVSNTNDSGPGSLRQAILSANTNGNPADQDIINFSIAGSGVQVIQPLTALAISQSVLINGYTQTGAVANTALAPNPFNGIIRVEINTLTSGTIQVTGNDVTLRGLSIYGGESGNVSVIGASNFSLFGSYLDTAADGLTAKKSITGVRSLLLSNAGNATIGGEAGPERNIFGFCAEYCIKATGSSTTSLAILGNYIGLGSDGIMSLDAPDIGGVGLIIEGGVSDVQIGGTNPGAGNSIEHNYLGAIQAQDSSNLSILGNRILANFRRDVHGLQGIDAGIWLGGVTDVTLGSLTGSGRNIISGNTQGSLSIGNSTITDNPSENIQVINNYFGVMDNGISAFANSSWPNIAVQGDSLYILIQNNIIHNSTDRQGITLLDNVQDVAILENSIYNNAEIGIDIGNNYIHETNDPLDSDSGPNTRLNSPGHTAIVENGGNTDVTFTIDVPLGDYRIDFFSNTSPDPSGIGEGEVFLDSVNITSLGTGLAEYTMTLPGISIPNLSLTATLIDPLSPTGFGPSSEFGAAGEAMPLVDPVRDLSVTKTLLNPEDVVLGGTLNYEITITNNGPNNLNLQTYNDTALNSTSSLFTDILPPQLAYSGVSGTGLTCNDLGAGSANSLGPALANHSSYGLVICGYTGASVVLGAGQSRTYVISALIVDDSDLGFYNYVIAQTAQYDPDDAEYQSILSGGNDIIDDLATAGVNNFASAYSLYVDMAISKRLLNPQDVASNATLNYQLTITNNGPSPVNLTSFNGSGMNPLETSLFFDIMPPNLEYLSQSNSDITCNWAGFGSAGLTPVLDNHIDHSLMLCVFSGVSTILYAGDSITTVVTVRTLTAPETFTNYAIAGFLPYDPDSEIINQALGVDPNNDFIDNLLATSPNNFATSIYPEPVIVTPGEGQNDASLGATGMNIMWILFSVVGCLGLSGYLLRQSKKIGVNRASAKRE